MIDLRPYLKLCLVLETGMLRMPLDTFIVQAVEGGVSCVQLRDKAMSEGDRYHTALKLKSLLAGKDVLFIINNSADIAVAVGAHGVHLGIEDLPPAVVKKTFPQLIAGYSCNNAVDVHTAQNEGADYAGIGPIWHTDTKANLRPVLGVCGLAEIVRSLAIPSMAIGGITTDNAALLKNSGIAGIAVSGTLCKSDSPYDTARALIKNLAF